MNFTKLLKLALSEHLTLFINAFATLLTGTEPLAQEEKPPNLAAESLTLALYSLSAFVHNIYLNSTLLLKK